MRTGEVVTCLERAPGAVHRCGAPDFLPPTVRASNGTSLMLPRHGYCSFHCNSAGKEAVVLQHRYGMSEAAGLPVSYPRDPAGGTCHAGTHPCCQAARPVQDVRRWAAEIPLLDSYTQGQQVYRS